MKRGNRAVSLLLAALMAVQPAALHATAPDGSGLVSVHPASAAFSLSPGGALVAGANVTISGPALANSGVIRAGGNLTVSADAITGQNGSFSAETGRAALAALGSITLEGGSVSGASVELVAGQDVVGKGLTIRSQGDASLFALGSVKRHCRFAYRRRPGFSGQSEWRRHHIDRGGEGRWRLCRLDAGCLRSGLHVRQS